jgi:hypothetical protein
VRLYVPEIAREVYGPRADDEASSLTAFAYMYRRFGPPPRGTDDHKRLGGAWILTTRDVDVYLEVDPTANGVSYDIEQFASRSLCEDAERPGLEWRREARCRYFAAHPEASESDYLLARLADSQPWLDGMLRYPRCPPEIVDRALAAIRHALLDLLRPVYVRDVAINLFGQIDGDNVARGRRAKRSTLAGLGVPVDAMARAARSAQ